MSSNTVVLTPAVRTLYKLLSSIPMIDGVTVSLYMKKVYVKSSDGHILRFILLAVTQIIHC